MSANFEVGIGVSVEGANKIPAFIKNLGDLANQHDKVKKSVNDTRNGVTKMVLEFNNLTKAEEKVVRAAIKKAGADAKAIKNADQLSAALSKLDTKIKSNEKAHESLTPAIKASDSATEGLTDAVNSSTVANDKNEKSTEKKTKATKEDNKAKKEAEREAKAQAKSERRLNEEYARQIIILNSLKAKIEAITKAHAIREAASKNFSSIVQNKIQQTSGVQAANQHGVIAAQTNLAQTRHNNALLRQQQNHNASLARMQQQHQNNMQRIAAQNARTSRGSIGTGAGFVGNVNSLPGVGKVIVYDALRRILTNIYQTVGKVGDEIVQWTKESIQFNDEMARSATVFRGFGLIGQKNKDGTSMSIADARSNPAMGASMMKIDKFSDKMMNTMTDLSMMTGQDMEEIVASSRQLTADLINKKQGPGGKSPLLDEKMGNELVSTTEAMVGLAAALKASDPGGRALKWHMVGLQELFSGSSGSKQDKGMSNVLSLMRREGIRIKEKEALPITEAVNKGDITKASELIQEVLDRAGQSTITFKNLLANTLMPNIDAIKTAFKKLSGVFHAPLFDFLLKNAISYREVMRSLMKNDAFNQLMKKYGVDFKKAFFPIIAPISDFFDKIKSTNGNSLRPYIETFLSITRNFNIIFANFITGVVGFFNGLLGVDSKKKFDAGPMIKFSAQFAASGKKMGEQLRTFAQDLSIAMAPVMDQFFPAMIAVGDIFIFLANLIQPIIRGFSQLAYELMNNPILKPTMKYFMGEQGYEDTKAGLYQKAFIDNEDGRAPGTEFTGLTIGFKGINALMGEAISSMSGRMLNSAPIVDEEGKPKLDIFGNQQYGSVEMAEYHKKYSNFGNDQQNLENNQARWDYAKTMAGMSEPQRKSMALERVADMYSRNKDLAMKTEGGLLPGGRGYDGPAITIKDIPAIKAMESTLKKYGLGKYVEKKKDEKQKSASVTQTKQTDKNQKVLTPIAARKEPARKEVEKKDFQYTPEMQKMVNRLNLGVPTQKDLAFVKESSEVIKNTVVKESMVKTTTITKEMNDGKLGNEIAALKTAYMNQPKAMSLGAPVDLRTIGTNREIIKQQPLVLQSSADPANKMPTSVDLAMKMMQNPMSFYGKMTTPSKAPFDMPKPSIPKVNIAEDKGFVVVVGKMINDKISKTKEPITLKGNLSQTTNITISTVNVNSNDSKQFVEQLKGISQSKPTDKKQTEIPPGFKPSRGGN